VLERLARRGVLTENSIRLASRRHEHHPIRDVPEMTEASEAASRMVADVTRAAEMIDRVPPLPTEPIVRVRAASLAATARIAETGLDAV
jgi:hypothetical protein